MSRIAQQSKPRKPKKFEFINQWNLLKKDSLILGIFKGGRVQSVSEDYFDIDILKHTENELKRSARTVGRVLVYSETIFLMYIYSGGYKNLLNLKC